MTTTIYIIAIVFWIGIFIPSVCGYFMSMMDIEAKKNHPTAMQAPVEENWWQKSSAPEKEVKPVFNCKICKKIDVRSGRFCSVCGMSRSRIYS